MNIKFELTEEEMLVVLANGTLDAMTSSVTNYRRDLENGLVNELMRDVSGLTEASVGVKEPEPTVIVEPAKPTLVKPVVAEIAPTVAKNESVTLEDVRIALVDAQKSGFKPQELIASYGVTNLTAIPASEYAGLLVKLSEAQNA